MCAKVMVHLVCWWAKWLVKLLHHDWYYNQCKVSMYHHEQHQPMPCAKNIGDLSEEKEIRNGTNAYQRGWNLWVNSVEQHIMKLVNSDSAVKVALMYTGAAQTRDLSFAPETLSSVLAPLPSPHLWGCVTTTSGSITKGRKEGMRTTDKERFCCTCFVLKCKLHCWESKTYQSCKWTILWHSVVSVKHCFVVQYKLFHLDSKTNQISEWPLLQGQCCDCVVQLVLSLEPCLLL